MLDIFYGVDVSVDVDVAVVCGDGLAYLGVLCHLHALEGSYGARLLGFDVACDESVALLEYVDGLSGTGVDHRPDAASVAKDIAVAAEDGEVAAGEELHDVLHPRVDGDALVGLGHLVHLDDEAREHPRLVHGVEIVHAVAALVAVEVGGIEEVVAKMAYEDVVGEITMKGFDEEVVTSDFA